MNQLAVEGCIMTVLDGGMTVTSASFLQLGRLTPAERKHNGRTSPLKSRFGGCKNYVTPMTNDTLRENKHLGSGEGMYYMI